MSPGTTPWSPASSSPGLSAVPAMSHAETTLSGAVPWGVAQAAGVVLGFVLLGPSLGLRASTPRLRRTL